ADVTVTSAQNNSVHSVASSGTLAVTANTFTLGAPSTTSGLALSGGTINGAGPLTVVKTLNWTGGGFDGAGTTAVAPGGTLTLSEAAAKGINDGYTVENGGTATFAGGNLVILNGGQFVN